ncbi:hypothetical protein [Nocardiopsis tropica]|jgi:hypothetical protein|uniref:Major facilitator superfamily (MFS) profile domain-containing protein n=1 Tax=Nocardiopsis tropica TaxID=109330 RepID=A0ABU7KVT0_9ACTN|nr:hypothetical protein [Nocardiopsis umidischolae]MEE2053413.1 hypothetical protein [Nocardiopsis umidischolae]
MSSTPLLTVLVSTLTVLLLAVLGLVVLALAFAAPPGRKGLVAASGSLITVGALLGGLVRAGGHYVFTDLGYGAVPPLLFTLFTLVSLVPGLVSAAGLLLLVVAATRRVPDPHGPPGTPHPPVPPTHRAS